MFDSFSKSLSRWLVAFFREAHLSALWQNFWDEVALEGGSSLRRSSSSSSPITWSRPCRRSHRRRRKGSPERKAAFVRTRHELEPISLLVERRLLEEIVAWTLRWDQLINWNKYPTIHLLASTNPWSLTAYSTNKRLNLWRWAKHWKVHK